MVVDMSSLMPDLVEKFALNAAVKPEAGRANPLSTKAADKIMLLDPRKAQNVGIALSSVVGRRTHEEVRNALHQVDEELFGGGIDRVQLLLNLGIFTDEVLSPVREYDGTCMPCAAAGTHSQVAPLNDRCLLGNVIPLFSCRHIRCHTHSPFALTLPSQCVVCL